MRAPLVCLVAWLLVSNGRRAAARGAMRARLALVPAAIAAVALGILLAACHGKLPADRAANNSGATASGDAGTRPPGATIATTLPDLSGSPAATATATATVEPGDTPTPTATPTATRVPPTPTPVFAPGLPTPTPPIPTNTPKPTATPTPNVSHAPVVRLKHPALRIDAEVEVVGIDAAGKLGVPSDPRKLGWYADLSLPGTEGNTVVSGYLYNNGEFAPFRSLNNSRGGDQVQLILADGTAYTYRVIRIERYERTKAPVQELIYPTRRPAGMEWLTMFTDGGNERDELGASLDVVIAERRPDAR